MTYQNLGFWIGQANDTSTGRHPTGWTTGQRWSETAGEWTAMYDTSQSALSSSQAALATMTTDRNNWQTSATDSVGTLGGDATPGYAASQLWSATATQWKGQADQRWGATRDYNNGETWEAAYARVLPAGAGQVPVAVVRTLAAGGPSSAAVWSGSSGAGLTPGHWVGMWTFAPSTGNTPDGQVTVYLRKSGVQQGAAYATTCQNGRQTTYNGWAEFDIANTAEVVDLFCSSQVGSNGGPSPGTFRLVFIPTPSFPH